LKAHENGIGSVRTARAVFVSSGRDSSAPLTVSNTVVILTGPFDYPA
jgi:hypothetical protein